MPESQTPGVKSQSSARERFRQAAESSAKRSAKTRPAAPTRSIEPGVIHHQIAKGLLVGVKNRAETAGIPLDVGELPEMAETIGGEDTDPQRIEKAVAHAVARIGDRFTLFRRVSRHFEGRDKRAGILSDITVAMMELYRRNPETLLDLSRQLGADIQQRRAAARAPANGGSHTPAKPPIGVP